MSQSSATPDRLQAAYFLLRRLHSLTGLIPVGVFLCFHLFTNFQMLVGDFQHEVDFIHAMPALYYVEVSLWGAIGFHAALGLWYTFVGAKPNAIAYNHTDNWRYTLQRITGVVALVFIFVHVAHFRWRWEMAGIFMPFFAHGDGLDLAHATTAYTLQHGAAIVFYLVGALASVYHFANGLWTIAITWGVTQSVGAMQRWGYACLGLGIVLSLFTIGAVIGAATYEFTDQEIQTIEKMIEAGGPATDAPSH